MRQEELIAILARDEGRRLANGGDLLDFDTIQIQAKNYAGGDKSLEIDAFHTLDWINTRERNRRTFDKNYQHFSAGLYNREIERQMSEEDAARAAKAGNLLGKAKSVLFSVKQQTKQQ